MKIYKNEWEENVKCIKIINDVKRLQTYEALLILKTKPSINYKLKNFKIPWGCF